VPVHCNRFKKKKKKKKSNTLPELQHAFCKLWKECVEKAKRQPPFDSLSLQTFTVHPSQGTHAAPRHFSASTPDFDHILYRPELYPSCDIQDHRPDSTIFHSLAIPLSTQPSDSPYASLHRPTSSESDALRLAEELNVITGTFVRHDNQGNARELSGVPSYFIRLTRSSQPIFSGQQQATRRSRTAPASTAPILNQPLGSYDAGPASTSNAPASCFARHPHLSPTYHVLA
jgi:hypothetical protein